MDWKSYSGRAPTGCQPFTVSGMRSFSTRDAFLDSYNSGLFLLYALVSQQFRRLVTDMGILFSESQSSGFPGRLHSCTPTPQALETLALAQ
ncbi:Oxidative Stress-Induced Growth Inhibitor 2 [Manis pentadactyla]|nr:Oxidative Stress-Induced Growth Inhibitor 2 [Manis pentadactyla]